MLLNERFAMTLPRGGGPADASLAGALPVPSTPQGQFTAASQLLQESLALLREAGSHQLAADQRVQHGLATAEAYMCLGQIRLLQGDPTARRGCSPTA